MGQQTLSERADELSRRRAAMLPLLALVFLSQQASYLSDHHGDRLVDHVKIGAWVVLSLVLLLGLVTKGFWFRSRELRDLLDDETTRANRSDALGKGFIAAILTAIAAYFINQFQSVRGDEAGHLVVTIGIATALIRFGYLERRALRDA